MSSKRGSELKTVKADEKEGKQKLREAKSER